MMSITKFFKKEKIEEEQDAANYGPEGHLEVKPGDFLHDYCVLRPLGSGAFSTVWLCWDTKESRFVALKVIRSARHCTEAAIDELKMLLWSSLKENDKNGSGQRVLQSYDEFVIEGPFGLHVCIATELLDSDLLKLIKKSKFKGLSLKQVRCIARQILEGLRHLHDNCAILHTDLKPENVLVCMTPKKTRRMTAKALHCAKRELKSATGENKEAMEKVVQQLKEHTKLKKSVKSKGKKENKDVEVKIGDLGNGCWVKEHFSEQIQARPYRSPEVIIGAGYGPAADIWSAACLLFELATGSYLFEPVDDEEDFPEDDYHLARMIELLGPMSPTLFRKGVLWRHFFAKSGEMLNITPPSRFYLHTLLTQKHKMSDKKARDLADFLTPMLELDQTKRVSASDCLKHPWLGGK